MNMVHNISASSRGKGAYLLSTLFVVLTGTAFLMLPSVISAQSAAPSVPAPASGIPKALPADHLIDVLNKAKSNLNPADASAFTGTAKIGGATAATRSAIQIAKIDLTISDEGGLTELLRMTRTGRNTWRFGMQADQSLLLYPTNQVLTENPDFHIANSSGTPFATFSPDTGSVGIGKTDPQRNLHVYGTTGSLMKIENNGSGNAALEIQSDNNRQTAINFLNSSGSAMGQLAYDQGTGIMTLNTAGAERMRIDVQGRVGIGTTTPGAKLDVSGNALMGVSRNIEFGDDGSENGYIKNWNTDKKFSIWTRNSASTMNENFTILGNGKVGIGTTSPGKKLDILDTATNSQPTVRIQNSDLNTGPTSVATFNQYLNGSSNNWNEVSLFGMSVAGNFAGTTLPNARTAAYFNDSERTIFATYYDKPFYVVQNAGVNPTYPLTIAVGGKVGIGKTDPQRNLHVYGTTGSLMKIENNGSGNAALEIQSDNNRQTAINFLNSGGSAMGQLAYDQGTGTMTLNTAGAERMRIDTNGNVGIGTTDPGAYKLNVNGKTYLGGNSTLLSGSDTWGEGLNIDSPPDVWGGIKLRRTNRSGSKGNWHLGYMANDGDNKLYLWEGNDSKAVATFEHNGTVTIPRKVNVGTLCFGVSCLNKPSDIYQWGVNGKDIYYPTGNVGIGTTTPGAKLDVSGNALMGVSRNIEFGDDGSENGYIKNWNTDKKFSIWTRNSASTMNENFTILGNGNVGIGTTSAPDVKLHVVGSALFDQGAACCGIHFRQENAGRLRVGAAWGLPGLYSEDSQDIVLGVAGWKKAFIGSWGNFMTVQGDGKVGIGTTTPGAKLDVSGNALMGVSRNIEFGDDGSENGYIKNWNTDKKFSIWTRNSASTMNENFTILGNGKVGIGTTTPAGNLHVYNVSAGGDTNITIDSSGPQNVDGAALVLLTKGNNGSAGIGSTTTKGWYMVGRKDNYGDNRQNYLEYWFADGTNWPQPPKMVITPSGRVGINTFQPCENCSLDVHNGDINVAFSTDQRFADLPEKTKLAYETDRIGLDVAELFESEEQVEVGDIVVVANNNRKLKKSSEQYQGTIVGVVSGAPAILFEGSQLKLGSNPERFARGTKPPVALAGRITVKVSLENGPIKPGDYLTSSSTHGVAMKATEPGMTIGVALESYNDSGEGKILVFLNLGEKNVDTLVQKLKKIEDQNGDLQRRIERLERGYRKTYW